jgi:hypothetical protein
MVTSDKHNPRVDEQMRHDSASFLQGAPVDARVDEQRRQEGLGPRPGQASADAVPPDRARGTSEGMAPIDVDRRSELASYVAGAIFPGDRDDLLEAAHQRQAPQAVIDLIEGLPAGQPFDRFESVWERVTSH